MKQKLKEQYETILAQLRELDKQNRSGSQTMKFEDEDQVVDFVLNAQTRFEQWKREMNSLGIYMKNQQIKY